MHDELQEIRELQKIRELQAETLVLLGEHEAAVAKRLAAISATKRHMAELAEQAASIQRERRKRRRRRGGRMVVVPIAAGCAGVAEFAKAQPAAAAAVVAVGSIAAVVGFGLIEQPGITHKPPPVAGQRPAVVSPGTPPPPSGRRPTRPTRLEPVAFTEPITAAPSSRRRPPARISVGGTTVRVTPHAPAVGTPRLPRPTLPPTAESPPMKTPVVEPACVADVTLVTRVRLLCPE
jgi:hypothetical protein